MKKLIFLSLMSFTLFACDRTDKNTTASDEFNADNTGRNLRDRNATTVLPTDQSENESDRLITKRIREIIIEDAGLSSNGKNVKIITVNGIVTLRGPVNSTEEKDTIGKKATQTRGVSRVDNQLEVVQSR